MTLRRSPPRTCSARRDAVDRAPRHAPSLDVVRTIYDASRDELAAVMDGVPGYRVEQAWHGLYRDLRPAAEIVTLPKDLRAALVGALPEALIPETTTECDGGTTRKYLWRLTDGGHPIESVLMHYRDRSTVCVSTQAGCAMACGFCATGQAGFTRHLTSGEIVEQVIRAARDAATSGRRLSNVVFMGMGEPLANPEATWSAVERLHGDLGMSARSLTISTVGIVPGIRALAERSLPVNLAVSLHAARDALRDQLVPINRRYPIAVLLDACADYLQRRRRRISFEWAMIDGTNDTARDANELADVARSLSPHAHVNLIPLNPTPGWPTRGTPLAQVRRFAEMLAERGVNATVRANRGTSIAAACGQLAAGQPVTMRSTRAG